MKSLNLSVLLISCLAGCCCKQEAQIQRYLLYDVNPGEGFNLRRDVYIRMANLVKMLNAKQRWVLVLPPWTKLYHWKSKESQNVQLPWSTFFDLESLSLHVPIMEFEDYIKQRKKPVIELVWYLQSYKEGWDNGEWRTKAEVRPCNDPSPYAQDDGRVLGPFWGYDSVFAKRMECLSAQADVEFFRDVLLHNTSCRAVMLDRAETLIHGSLSEWSSEYWRARRSMRFSGPLRDIGDEFRKRLDSSDEADGTVLGDWREKKKREAVGGPYLAVHLRRRDYLYAHRDHVPSLHYAAETIAQQLQLLNLSAVFVATDAPWYEFDELKKHLTQYQVFQYEPEQEVLKRYSDGGVAIVDQWICAHARHFIGTSYSTFSFRIHEEREILGFKAESTFNAFCDEEFKANNKCEQPTKWLIQY